MRLSQRTIHGDRRRILGRAVSTLLSAGRRGRRSVLVAATALMTAVSGVAVVLPATPSPAACAYSAWMGCQRDSLYVSQLSIPGTHDTGALWADDGIGCVPAYTVAQTMNTFDQLNAGVRYLDIRFGSASWSNPRLRVYHGFCGQHIYADTVGPIPSGWYALMTDILYFLRLHPTETVILSVKDEDGSQPYIFEQLMADLIARTGPSRWWLNNWIPRLSEARGKVVLVRRFAHKTLNIGGMDASAGWPNNTTGSFRNFVVEDVYNGFGLSPDAKLSIVAKALDDAHRRQAGGDINMFVTFASANGAANSLLTIDEYARTLNSYLANRFPSSGPSGIVAMDKVTPTLIHSVVDANR